MLTTGALRSRLSLKYRRVQFGWFGCPAVHLYHHRSVTYGLSSLSSLRCSPPVLLYYVCTSNSLPYSEFPFCSLSAVRTPTKLHPLPLLLVLLLRITGIYRQRAARLPNPIPPTHPAGSNLHAVLLLLSVLLANFSLFPSRRSRGCRTVVDFFQPPNDCGKCRCFGPADASITARHCTLRSSIFEISM